MSYPNRSVLFLMTLILLLAASWTHAQRAPVDGMRQADLRAHAIVGATVITEPGHTIENATIIIRDGVIEAVGEDIDVPNDARIWPGEGLTVYPGLIDAALLISPGNRPDGPGAHWNRLIHPQIDMAEQSDPSANVRRQMRELGFTVAAVYPDAGILRGTGTVIALADDHEHVLAYRDRAAMMAGFSYGRRWAAGGYPGSLMGAIALLRQTLYDAQWHATCQRIYLRDPEGHEPPIRADALAALGDVIERRQRLFFEVDDELNALRAASIAREFNLDMMLLGSGLEFRRLDAIRDLDMPVVVPLNFPDRPNVNTLATAERTTLREMMTWEQAPTNARRLVDSGATIALTTHGLDRRRQFHAALRNAIRHGLSEDDALAALTTVPATLLGIDDVAGTIEPGKAANLVVVDGKLFDREMKIRDTWINGRRHEITAVPDITYVGKGVLTTDLGHEIPIEFNTVRSRITLKPKEATSVRAANVTVTRDQISFIIDGSVFEEGPRGFARLSGVLTDETVTGNGVMPDGTSFSFTITAEDIDEAEAIDDEQPHEKADDDAADADAGEQQEDDPVAGAWHVIATIEGFDEPFAVTITLTRRADGSITGTSSSMGSISEIRNASFNEATGELRYEITTPGSVARIVAQIDGDRIHGTVSMETMQGEFSGSRRTRVAAEKDETEDDRFEMPPDELVYPLGAYGLTEPLTPREVVVHNATIWTAGPQGIIEHGWMLVRDGKIEAIGAGEPPGELRAASRASSPGSSVPASDSELFIIDASGKHISPGLIDCHSHTGITAGVNEWTHANTAEVRIADVINPDDINWYRQLAGGLTVANQLHGSANPIGGQNSVVKLKWGGLADSMLIDDAIAGIKFALGENVVRSQSRYPNTRMGVETTLRDAFTAAREYEAEWNRYLALNEHERMRTMPPRRDLTLDALAEILNGERLVHCHSYRQDEILMLIRVAEDFGFTIGTFQHVLEGYKVAEAIAAHGAGASAFSDWWGFKMEVMDAIPHAGAIMHAQGVNVSFNSDSSELARRMNNEASKAVRFGDVDPHEALKFITINPAWQLRIDHRTGSLEEGKDADFVIWSGDPLSTYSRTEQTWIEGVRYFEIEEDRQRQQWVDRERQRLIQKILTDEHGELKSPQQEQDIEGDNAGERERPTRLMARLIERRRQMMEEEYRLGRDPEEIRPGDCGCNEFWFDLTRSGLR